MNAGHEKLGFVGLGHMGGNMASRYLSAGYSVYGEARSREGLEHLPVRREGCDVYERRHVGMVASFGHHRSAIGVANENDRLALCVDGALDHGDVVFERKSRILDDADAVAVLAQQAVDTLPAGAVDETPVNQNNRPRF